MNDFFNESTVFHFGGRNDDTLTVNGDVAVGLGGNDRLTSIGLGGSLLGGAGNDRYYARGELTLIGDTGGRDELYLDGYDYEGGFLDNKHLIMVEVGGSQAVVVWDFKGAGRIETFYNSTGISMSAQEVERYVYTDGIGDIPNSDLYTALRELDIDQATYQGVLENELALVRLNWDNVFQALAKAGRSDSEAFAAAIKNEIWPGLSLKGHLAWDLTNSSEALAASDYIGFEQNMPAISRPVLAYEQVADMALLYEAALGRKADTPGLNYFVGNMQEGQSLQDIARSFVDSVEFQQGFASFDNRSYIEKLYLNVLKRSADEEGIQYWLADMEHGRTQENVLVSFAQSAENKNNAVWLAGLNYDASSEHWVI